MKQKRIAHNYAMNAERWEQIKDIFAAALEHPAEKRELFLDDSCGTDAELRTELRRLLDEHALAGRYLSDPAVSLAEPFGTEQPPRFSPSKVLANRFRIVRFLARGGMGEVYEAEDLELHGRVALKTLRENTAADRQIIELFKQEIHFARRVTHPNVCRIFDLAQHIEDFPQGGETVHFLTMELLEGEPLAHHLRKHGPFAPDEALPLIEQMTAAVCRHNSVRQQIQAVKPGQPAGMVSLPHIGGLNHR